MSLAKKLATDLRLRYLASSDDGELAHEAADELLRLDRELNETKVLLEDTRRRLTVLKENGR